MSHIKEKQNNAMDIAASVLADQQKNSITVMNQAAEYPEKTFQG